MMKQNQHLVDCAFCQKFGHRSEERNGQWFDEVLAETTNFCAVAGIGAFAPGYVMIVTKRHVVSMASMPDAWCEEFLQFRMMIADAVTALYGPVSFFEHASRETSVSSGSCIDHAHLHIYPTVSGVTDRLRDMFPLLSAADFLQARPLIASHPYLYLEEAGSSPIAAVLTTSVPSQTFRRLIASELGAPDEWDWAVYPNLHHVLTTIAAMKSRLSDDRESHVTPGTARESGKRGG